MKPAYAIPGGVVGAVLLLAVFIQPSAATTPADELDEPIVIATATPAFTVTTEPTATATADTSTTAEPTVDGTSEVAGVQSTPEPTATEMQAVTSAQCGALQEGTFIVGVTQTLSGVSVEATQVSVYPISYLHCLLLATGGHDAVTLASALGDAERAGSTHVALVDIWITNGSRDFAQLTLNTVLFSAAGQNFPALGTLGGGAEAVIASGQGRAVTVVGTVTNTIGSNTGPITLSLEGPWLGGVQVAGKYQLFLPTP
jgi:hypothetical protein